MTRKGLFIPALCYALAVLEAASAQLVAADTLASQYSMTTSTSMPFPSATQSNSDTQSFIVSNWGLSRGRIQDGAPDLDFVNDPFPNDATPGASSNPKASGPVLQITYPNGSYSHDTGGAQLYSLWNTSDSSLLSMMVSYEIAFDSGFDWVQGGKLPGLRGGPNPDGCSGGSNVTDGSDCFSTRLMWRKQGEGEIYAYIPTSNGICKDSNIICNSDFGTSIGRGEFSFASGQWNRITLIVQLNNPVNVANGFVSLYYNDVHAISQQNLQLRSSDVVTAGGLYLSTFFGGNDPSWATPNTAHTYLRNFRLWGSSSPSNSTGSKVNAAARLTGLDSSLQSISLCLISVTVVLSTFGLL
ncbi:polysaccharide lyase family 14 protein [Neolentinus lepideus HHB14362 ss-1]|uniref:Polysaccharide lyase family 14 protein n=1 Tax=Neolentinus lepideus HHB14362 ss-1 TaxID=1314782 RepID=A0A165TJ61_9AGAM|nr:polysaccharide lyase family 14 protein [Neolentinus lepideus HHB14362 ss-1]